VLRFDPFDAPVQGRPGHAQITCHLGCRSAACDEATGVFNLGVGEPFPASAQIFARGPPFTGTVGDPFPLDLQFHLGQGPHDGEHDTAHGRAGINVPATQIQHTQIDTPVMQFFGESEHVGGGTPEPVQCGDDQGVALLQRLKRPIECWPAGPGAADPMVDIQVVAADPNRQQVRCLPVGGLRLGRYPGVSDQLAQTCLAYVNGVLTPGQRARAVSAGSCSIVRDGPAHRLSPARLRFGVSTTGGPLATGELNDVAALVNENPSIVMSYKDFAQAPISELNSVDGDYLINGVSGGLF
jgi:hypothetical protein